MKRIVLLRHGESLWNRDDRFTGWTDVDLTPQGEEEALRAGRLLRRSGIRFGRAYTSLLTRAIRTLDLVLHQMNLLWIPVEKSWRLNEKHYGILQGRNKAETAARYGAEQVLLWRRSYDTPPAPIPADDPRHPRFDLRYRTIPTRELPATESLRDTIARTIPYWSCEIVPALAREQALLVVAHGNSLRGILKHLRQMSDTEILGLNLPTAAPCVVEFDEGLNYLRDYFLDESGEDLREVTAPSAGSLPR